jgi:hypothetical protein
LASALRVRSFSCDLWRRIFSSNDGREAHIPAFSASMPDELQLTGDHLSQGIDDSIKCTSFLSSLGAPSCRCLPCSVKIELLDRSRLLFMLADHFISGRASFSEFI